MNDQEFEDKLRALAGALQRPDPTPTWKADMLARARRSRETGGTRAPRVMLVMLGMAWLLIAALRLTTPPDTAVPESSSDSGALAAQGETPLRALMAFQSHRELLDLP